jgi:hypothetical protein
VLNKSRVLFRRSLSTVLGAGIVFGGEAPDGYYESMVDSDHMAEKLKLTVESSKRQAKSWQNRNSM